MVYNLLRPATFTKHNTLKFIQIVLGINILFLFIVKQYSIVWLYDICPSQKIWVGFGNYDLVVQMANNPPAVQETWI